MIERVFDAVGSLGGPWAYMAVGALAAGESSLGVGLVLPGETGMIIGGFIVSQGNADFWLMLLVAITGAIVGDSIGYEIGRRFGPAIRRTRLGRAMGDERWQSAEEYLALRGGRAIFFARFLAVIRSLVPAVAGITGMPYRKFLLWNAIGGVLWASIYVSIGFFAGRSYERVADRVEDAGYIVLGLVVLVAAVAWVARWMARHPDRVGELADRFATWRPVAALRRTFGGPLRFVQRRFQIDDAFGLSLTLGLLFIVITGWALSAVATDVVGESDLVGIDRPTARYLAEHRVDWLTDTMDVVTDLGGANVLIPLLGVVGLAWTVRRGRWGVLLFFALALGGAILATDVLKELIERTRPSSVFAAVEAQGFAFPSGHAAQATTAYGALAYVHGAAVRAWAARVAIWAAAVVLVVLVAFSRLYLGVHWTTDVLGGMALGAAWLSVVTTAFSTSARFARRHLGGGDQRSRESSRAA